MLKIYLKLKNNKLHYRLCDPDNPGIVIQDSISFTELGIPLKAPLDEAQLTENLLQRVLEITTKRKQTNPEEKLPPNLMRALVEGHYIHLRAISLDKENPNFVHLKMSTWGTEVTRKIRLDELAGFFEGNAALAGITPVNFASYSRTLSIRRGDAWKTHPFIYLKHLKNTLREWFKEGDYPSVDWDNNGQLIKVKIPESLHPLIPVLNKLRPSMTNGEYLDLAIEVQNIAKSLPMDDKFRKTHFTGTTYQFIPNTLRHLYKFPEKTKELIPLLSSIIIQHDDSYEQLITMAKVEDSPYKEIFDQIDIHLDAEYRNNFEIPLKEYRKHLLDEMQQMGHGFAVTNQERQVISWAIRRLALGQDIPELPAKSGLIPGFDSLNEQLNKCIRKANAVNRALNSSESPFKGCEAIRHAQQSLMEYRKGQEMTDFQIIHADRSSPARNLVKSILTFFACLMILPVGFIIAKSLINKERIGDFCLYSSTGSHLISAFFNYDTRSREQISDHYIDANCYNLEITYKKRPYKLEFNKIYLYLQGKELYYRVLQEDKIIDEPVYKPHIGQYYQPIAEKLKHEGASLTHEEQKALLYTFGQKGYVVDEENSGKHSLS